MDGFKFLVLGVEDIKAKENSDKNSSSKENGCFAVVLILIGIMLTWWDLGKWPYLENHAKQVQHGIAVIEEKLVEIEEFKTEHKRLPTHEELNCGVPKHDKCYFWVWKIIEKEDGEFIVLYDQLSPIVFGHLTLGNLDYKYDPKTKSSNQDYRNSYIKVLGLFLLEMAFNSLFFLVPLYFYIRNKKARSSTK